MRTQPDPRTSTSPRAAPSILTEITIDHGPAELLAPLFLRAENALRTTGIQLSFGGLEDLERVNAENRDNWLPLFPIYHPRYWPSDDPNVFCLFGREASGRVVTTFAVRIYDWPATTFHDEAVALRLFYADAARSRRPGENCNVSAPATRTVRGRVGLSGAVWVHPDWRGSRNLTPLIGRIARAYSIARWNIDYYTLLMTPAVHKGGLASKSAIGNVEWSLDLTNSPLGDLKLGFLWMTRAELHDDLSRFLVELDPQVDVGVRHHRAQENART